LATNDNAQYDERGQTNTSYTLGVPCSILNWKVSCYRRYMVLTAGHYYYVSCFWVMELCRCLGHCQKFGNTYCPDLQGKLFLPSPVVMDANVSPQSLNSLVY